jgi:hypothetical protein
VDSFDDYSKTFACTTDGSSVAISCPLGDETHTCDFDTYGSGSEYIVNYVCPKVLPLCLWFDTSAGAFSADGCSVAAGYTSSAVTCECNFLPATFALSAYTTGAVVASTTTQAPTLQPTIEPTQFPTQFPTLPPSPKPTPEPTHLPTKGSVTAVAVTFTITATAAPSAQDETDLETAVTASLTDGSVTDFMVTSSQTARRRLLLAAQDALPSADAHVEFAASPAAKDTSSAVRPHGRRLLATYAWAVSLTVVADLSTTTTTYSSAAAFASAVAASLNANLASQISIASVSSVGTVSAAFVSRTKAPSPLPSTLHPTPLPSPLADPDPYADDDTAWVELRRWLGSWATTSTRPACRPRLAPTCLTPRRTPRSSRTGSRSATKRAAVGRAK